VRPSSHYLHRRPPEQPRFGGAAHSDRAGPRPARKPCPRGRRGSQVKGGAQRPRVSDAAGALDLGGAAPHAAQRPRTDRTMACLVGLGRSPVRPPGGLPHRVAQRRLVFGRGCTPNTAGCCRSSTDTRSTRDAAPAATGRGTRRALSSVLGRTVVRREGAPSAKGRRREPRLRRRARRGSPPGRLRRGLRRRTPTPTGPVGQPPAGDVGLGERRDRGEPLVVQPSAQRGKVVQPLDGLRALGMAAGGEQVGPGGPGVEPVLAMTLTRRAHGSNVTPSPVTPCERPVASPGLLRGARRPHTSQPLPRPRSGWTPREVVGGCGSECLSSRR
jgi:hypothetical protein